MSSITKLTQGTLRQIAAPIAAELGIDVPKSLSLKATGPLFADLLAGVRGLKLAGASIYGRNPDREDGFNPIWYMHANPDIVAAGADPYDHWRLYGRQEGRAAYEGAGRTTMAAKDLIFRQGPPVIDMPDVYAPPGAKEVRVRVRLLQDGEPDKRSFSIAGARGVNVPGQLGYGAYGDTWHDGRPFFPSSGSEKEFVIQIPEPHAVGPFDFFIGGAMDFPRIEARCKVFLNTAPPAGYRYPDALPARALPKCPSAKGGFDTDFLGDLSADWEVGHGDLNGGRSGFAWPGATTKSGKRIDCYPIETINGKRTRVLRPVDCRLDPMITDKGIEQPYAMPKLVLPRGSAYGVWELDATLPPPHRVLNFAFWAILLLGGWPPEWDHFEYRGSSTEANTHSAPDDLQQRARFWKSIEGRHTITVERTRDWYRIWVDGELVVENPNYLGDAVMGTTICIEGPGSAACDAPYDPADDLTPYGWQLHGFRYRAYA